MSGVIGIYSDNRKNVSQLIYYGLYALQHRGQVSSGIAVNNNGFVDYYKDLGLANEVFSSETLQRLTGNIGVGHVQYASQREGKGLYNAQPLVGGYKRGALALSLDGSVVNFKELKDEMEESGGIFQTHLEAEVIANLITRYHKDGIEASIIKAISRMIGSYSMVLMTTDTLIGARDPYGLKPLSLGKLKGDYILASETCALDTIGAKFIRDVEPGEVITINEKGIHTISHKPIKSQKCLFEFIYLARPDSQVNGKSIYSTRWEAGKELYKEWETEGDVVIGAPDSGVIAALGYAEESKIPYAEGIIKNRYVGRTFIQPTQELREEGVRIKLNVLKENVNGKRVILVDDSIVRGTTIKRTVDMLKKAGAHEIHVRISSPPVIHSCYLGVDTPSEENLMAANKTVEEIRQEIDADSLCYLSLEGLIKAIDQKAGFCSGCFTGKYPV